jgi:hypothetical protein
VRIAAIVVALGFAAAAVTSTIDRLSERSAALAQAVPTPFRAQGWRTLAAQALAQHHAPGALLHARAAVAHDPGDWRGAALIGAARLEQKDFAGADAAYRVSARFGWREPTTQLYWAARSLDAGDVRLASERIDALLRQDPRMAQGTQAIAVLEASPAGRAALAERLSARPEWLPLFLTDLAGLDGTRLERRASVAQALAARGVSVGCVGIGSLVTALLSADLPRQALDLWRSQCPTADGNAVPVDGGLHRLGDLATPGPFDWTFPGDSDVTTGIGSFPARSPRGGKYLGVSSTAPVAKPVMSQRLALTPGRYRLAWSAIDEQGNPSSRIRPGVSCFPADNLALGKVSASKGGPFTATLAVPAGCTSQSLSFSIIPGAGAAALTDITVKSIR